LLTVAISLSIVGSPVGGESRANETIAGHQGNPAVCVASDGSFVVAWESAGQDGDGYGVYARMFDSSGSPIGSEFRVNDGTDGDQRYPEIGMNSDGEFDIVWQGWGDHRQGPNYLTLGVFKRAFDSSGSPTANDVVVNTETDGDQIDPSIAMAGSSRHVIAWTDPVLDGSGEGIYAERYGPSENPFGNFQANTYTSGNQNQSSVAMSDLADFVVVWRSEGQDGAEGGIFGQRFSNGGAPMGTEFRVNTITTGDQSTPSIDVNSTGAMTVAWASYGQDGDGYGIYCQRFDEDGAKVGSEFRVNSHTGGHQTSPSVAMSPGGEFVVVWVSDSQDGSGKGVYAQQYDETGAPVGSEFRVNTWAENDQEEPSASWGPLSSFVIAWSSELQDGDSGGVYFQRFDEVPIPEFSEVLAPVIGLLLIVTLLRIRRGKRRRAG